MGTRLLDTRAWVVLLVCLNSTACFRSVDGTKVRCTSSDHCPDNFICSVGKCVSHSTATIDGGALDTELVSAVDSAKADAVGIDAAGPHADVALSGSDADVPAAVILDGATPDTTTADLLIDLSSSDATDVPLPGTGGVGGAGGVTGSGGRGGSTGGPPGSGGVIGSGGITASGGALGSGGTVATGGVLGTGGITGTGGATTCQPKARDCTSSLDNNCNGTPDNQETTYCACTVGNSQACLEHPGYDGKGICKAGSQTCALSTDKTTSSWGTCTPGVAPGTRNCTSTADNDCNGTPDKQETAYCQCAAGTSGSCQPAGACTAGTQACTASSDNTTTSWGACGGYTSPTLMYRDFDGDGYGDPSNSAQVCPGTAGYKTNNDDCDDGNAAFHPDLSICSSATQRRTCTTGSHGVPTNQPCDYGCMAGACRPSSDGMVGVPGYVSCLTSNPQRCLAGDGCKTPDGTCGYSTEAHFTCDGPNDCTGQDCWLIAVFGWLEAKCSPTKPTDSTVYKVCDPLASTCASPLTCTRYGGSAYSIFVCQ